MFAKKSLGQNFLISNAPVKKMIELSSVTVDDIVLEIGPGKGVLTKALLETGATVIAVEKDDHLIPFLRAMFVEHIISGKLTLIHADVLEKEVSEIVGDKNYKLIANIPYYITGEIIRKFLEADHQPTSMALLVQKEVADRAIARDGKESILSMSVKVYGVPSSGGTVKRTLFRPIPNVDSAVLYIGSISKSFFDTISEQAFFEIVKKGFSQKRKQLKGLLKDTVSEDRLKEVIGDPTRRAETLTRDEWKKIVLLTR